MQNQADGLDGTTPTGYESEGYELLHIKEINDENEVEKKVKKAFKLKQIPEEVIIVKLIYQKFLELKSQTALETFLMNNNIKTKNGKYFSRFAIKGILENPVYAKNDNEMYNYFVKNNVELYSKKEEFDGQFGIMAYNKTKQVKHKATKKTNLQDWIVSVRKTQRFYLWKRLDKCSKSIKKQ